jgi:Fungal specific transcription factor domain/Fungal Zn(2)-Cys(6) binuclear cluster domain
MVGVAGKSKGCSTCRKRKKGCDLARPSCGQCVKSGHPCGGYQKDLTFIHHKVPRKVRLQSLPKKFPQQAGAPLAHSSSWPATSDGVSTSSSSADEKSSTASPHSGWDRSAALVQKHPWPSQSPPLCEMPPNLTLTALTTLHTSLFNSFFLPRNSFSIKNSFSPYGHPANWTQFVPLLLNNDPSLQLAYLAASCSRIGHDNHDDNLLASSKKFYGKALREVQRAISDPKRRYTEETLLACSTLGLYEIFESQTSAVAQPGSTPNGWLSHSAGVARLLEARGPESYSTDRGHPIFLHTRIFVTIRASTARKACFLSQPQWLTIPWRNHPKNMQHKLVDIMVFMPVVLEMYDKVQESSGADTEARRRGGQALLERCDALNQRLGGWYNQLCAMAKGRPLWHTTPSDDPSHPFPELISFDDHNVGYTIMLYWTCSLVMQVTMLQAYRLLNEATGDVHDAETLPNHINPRAHAVNIAQALPYFLVPDMGALGPNLALFPMGMAFAFFLTPNRPSFAADTVALKSTGSMVYDMIAGDGQLGDRSTKDVIFWFSRIFADLNSRNMPGGAFLAGLMKAVGERAAALDSRPISEM